VRDGELELGRLHKTNFSEKLLSFLFSDDVFRLLVVLEAQRSWVESERIQELFAPIISLVLFASLPQDSATGPKPMGSTPLPQTCWTLLTVPVPIIRP